MEFIDNIKSTVDSFLYSPGMIGVQIFSVILSIGLVILRLRMLKDMGDLERALGEKFGSYFGLGDESSKQIQKQENIDMDDLLKKWQDIEARMNTHDENEWKLAIIESDNLLEEALIRMGVKGGSLGERLKGMNINHYPFLDDAWKAHRVRNFLVHDSTYQLSARAVGETYNHYRRVFTDLGIVKSG